MSDVSYVPPLKKDTLYVQYIPSMPMLLLDTLALNLRTSLVTISSLGTPLCQTGAAKVVTVLSTKLTLLLKPSTMRMNVKQQKPQSVEYYLVNYNNNNNNKVYLYSAYTCDSYALGALHSTHTYSHTLTYFSYKHRMTILNDHNYRKTERGRGEGVLEKPLECISSILF